MPNCLLFPSINESVIRNDRPRLCSMLINHPCAGKVMITVGINIKEYYNISDIVLSTSLLDEGPDLDKDGPYHRYRVEIDLNLAALVNKSDIDRLVIGIVDQHLVDLYDDESKVPDHLLDMYQEVRESTVYKVHNTVKMITKYHKVRVLFDSLSDDIGKTLDTYSIDRTLWDELPPETIFKAMMSIVSKYRYPKPPIKE